MNLPFTKEEAAHYWMLLSHNVSSYLGSANLGQSDYQHLGIVIGGGGSTPKTQEVLNKYISGITSSEDAAEKFIGFYTTFRIRATGRPNPKGVYFELWTMYDRITFEESNPDREVLLKMLDTYCKLR
jgi:hypothetical protein